MRFDSRSARFLLWVIALAVLTVRASDTHLHLCFDGQEPPTTVHFADGSIHQDEHHETTDHSDKDYDPFVGLLSKSAGTDSDTALPVSVPAMVVLLPPDSSPLPSAPEVKALAVAPPFHLRPPLRGPPA